MKTFGKSGARLRKCEVIQVGVTVSGEVVYLETCSVPAICGPLSHQSIDLAKNSYKHLQCFSLADDSYGLEGLAVQMMVGGRLLLVILYFNHQAWGLHSQ